MVNDGRTEEGRDEDKREARRNGEGRREGREGKELIEE